MEGKVTSKETFRKNSFQNQKKKERNIPLREPDKVIESHVRISSNPEEIDIDKLMTKYIKNRSWHADHDSSIATESARQSIRDFIFQDTQLSAYKQFVSKKYRHIDWNKMQEILK